jgi:opacity protein-like surface antigen
MKTSVIRTLTLAVLVSAATVAAPRAAHAGDNWFVSPFIAAQFAKDAPRTSPGTGVSAGWWGSTWGAEIDVDYAPEFFARTDFSTDRRLTTVMVNGIYNLPWGKIGTRFVPYAGAGLGVLKPKLGEAGGFFTLDANKFGMNVGAGATSWANEHVGVRGDVRYFRGLRKSDADTNSFGIDFSTFDYWRVSVGLIARF